MYTDTFFYLVRPLFVFRSRRSQLPPERFKITKSYTTRKTVQRSCPRYQRRGANSKIRFQQPDSQASIAFQPVVNPLPETVPVRALRPSATVTVTAYTTTWSSTRLVKPEHENSIARIARRDSYAMPQVHVKPPKSAKYPPNSRCCYNTEFAAPSPQKNENYKHVEREIRRNNQRQFPFKFGKRRPAFCFQNTRKTLFNYWKRIRTHTIQIIRFRFRRFAPAPETKKERKLDRF